MNDLEIFHNAPENATQEELAAYLDEACGDDSQLRAKVKALFAESENDRTCDFLEAPAIEANLPTIGPDGKPSGRKAGSPILPGVRSEKEGDIIGPFTLIEQLGEGGFGAVWKAEQSEPFARTVALKIIKAGMDTREVLKRFEAERQALAMMNHENIAKVLDAGATENGRPFFVMEMVDGIPITKYCDQHQRDTRERLWLFRDVCAAVNHAHQKGLIHRDIKPSNVMVTEQDGHPVVKVIDFGIAKATENKLTEETMVTMQDQLIGTPAYMSPEQVGMDGLDIDTRSDIYSLGVLLYEMLAGGPPFDPKTLLSAGFDEMRRIVREKEPPRPSSRVNIGLDKEATALLSETHGAEPAKLSRQLRGDLDWIVMKAIEKDRGRRYETANAFAADVQRFLTDEPVVAAAPSAGYKFRKFARRNKVAFSVGATIAAVMIVATAFSAWQAVRATEAEKLATERLSESEKSRQEAEVARNEAEAARDEAEKIADYLADIFGSPDPGRNGRTITVIEALNDSVDKLSQDKQSPLDRKARLLQRIAETYGSLSQGSRSTDIQQKAFDAFSQSLGRDHPETLNAQQKLARRLNYIQRDGSVELLTDLVERRRRNDPEDVETIVSMQKKE